MSVVPADHRLVAIHPFPNGNGRCSPLAADLLALRLGQPRFTWGSANLVAIAETRRGPTGDAVGRLRQKALWRP